MCTIAPGSRAPQRLGYQVPVVNLRGTHCAAGCEDGSLRLWDARCSRPVVEVIRACSTRIKGVAAASAASAAQGSAGGGPADAPLAATASSDGMVRLWDMRAMASNRQAERALCLQERQQSMLCC